MTRPTPFSVWLDVFRWLAAWAVLSAHIGLITLQPYTSLPQHSQAHTIYSLLSGFGHSAVVVFFVLSGFLVGGSFLSAIDRQQASLKDYYSRRLARLWIVLIPALGVVTIANIIGSQVFNGSSAGIYPNAYIESMNLPTAACNAAFLQATFCYHYGGDNPLWSIANEAAYYATFPLLVLSWLRRRQPAWVAAGILSLVALIVLTLFQRTGFAIAPYGLIWTLGVVAARAKRPLVKIPSWAWLGLTVASIVAVRILTRRHFETEHRIAVFFIDFGISVLLANLLTSMKNDQALPEPPLAQVHITLANFSFSLYCLHYPLALLASSAFMHFFNTGYLMDPTHDNFSWVFVFANIAFCLLFSFTFAQLTEKNTDKIRLHMRKILFHLGRTPKAASTP